LHTATHCDEWHGLGAVDERGKVRQRTGVCWHFSGLIDLDPETAAYIRLKSMLRASEVKQQIPFDRMGMRIEVRFHTAGSEFRVAVLKCVAEVRTEVVSKFAADDGACGKSRAEAGSGSPAGVGQGRITVETESPGDAELILLRQTHRHCR